MTTRTELGNLLADNAVLIHNLLIAAAQTDNLDGTALINRGDPDNGSALIKSAKFQEELANQISTLIRKGDAESFQADPGTSEAELKELMRDPRYWRDLDPEIVAKVREGFRTIYG